MTDPEDFLSRWSRRKRDAGTETKESSTATDRPQDDRPDATRAAKPVASPPQQTRADARDAKPEDVFDLSKLPSLDSIGPATDIRMFLQPGVPEALSRAALRRAWSADPGIRDFIGLSENSWDFTASDGMHGFGALDPADAKRLLAQLFGEHDSKDDKGRESEPHESSPDDAVSVAEKRQDETTDPDSCGNTDAETVSDAAVPDTDGDTQQSDADAAIAIASQQSMTFSAASQQKTAEALREPALVPRSHGRALPQ
jgi:hypothetical protein